MGPERRNCARRILYSPEYLDMGADNGGVIVDLSESGLRFQVVSRVEPNSDVALSFSLGTGYRIDVHAHVVWVNPRGNSGGVAFKNLPNDSRSLIREWLAKPESEQRAEAAVSTPEIEEEPEDDSSESARPPETAAPAAEPEPALASAAADQNAEVFDESSRIGRIEEVSAPGALSQPTTKSAATRAAVMEIAPKTGVSEASALPRPLSFARPCASALPHPRPAKHTAAPRPGASFSAVPSISAWGAKGSSLPLSARHSPLRGAENIFARHWTPPELDEIERHSGSKAFLVTVFFLLFIIAALLLYAYAGGYRQQIGTAIQRIGSTVAGQTDSSAPAPPSANAGNTMPAVTGASSNASSTPQPQKTAPAPASPLTGSSSPHPAPPVPPVKSNFANASAPAPNLDASPSTGPQASQTAPSIPGDAQSAPPAVHPPQTDAPAYLHPTAQNQSSKSSASSNSAPPSILQDAARSEYLRGQQYLDGTAGVAPDPAEAAEWFWRSLEAGDMDAALPLADLYIAGKGVSRSCIQARILLDTAARKGNAEAAHKLGQLPESCN